MKAQDLFDVTDPIARAELLTLQRSIQLLDDLARDSRERFARVRDERAAEKDPTAQLVIQFKGAAIHEETKGVIACASILLEEYKSKLEKYRQEAKAEAPEAAE